MNEWSEPVEGGQVVRCVKINKISNGMENNRNELLKYKDEVDEDENKSKSDVNGEEERMTIGKT